MALLLSIEKILLNKPQGRTLGGVALLVGHLLTKLKVTGSIPGQGTFLGCGFSP